MNRRDGATGRAATSRYTRRGLLATIGAACVPLAGCGYRPGAGDVAWRETFEYGPVLAAGDTLVDVVEHRNATFETTGARFEVYDASTADRRDSVELDAPVRGVTGGERCYFLTDHEVGAVETDGSLGWTRALRGSPVAMGAGAGTVALLHEDGEVDAYDGGDGSERWRADTAAVSESDRRTPDRDVAVDAAGAVVGSFGSENHVAAIDASGDVRWERDDLDGYTDESALTVGEDAVLVPHYSHLTVFDRATGDRRFRLGRSNPDGAPAVVDGTVYAAQAGDLNAYDVESGDRLWRAGTTPGGVELSLDDAVADEDGVFAAGLRGVHGFSPDGQRRWFASDIASGCWLFSSVVVAEVREGYAAFRRERG